MDVDLHGFDMNGCYNLTWNVLSFYAIQRMTAPNVCM